MLQARDAGGKPIVTMMNLAAHNQEIGHSDDRAAAGRSPRDWPGYFQPQARATGSAGWRCSSSATTARRRTRSPSRRPRPALRRRHDGCYAQAQATGEAFADAVAGDARRAREPARRRAGDAQPHATFFVPLENNLFKAAAAAGLFGERQLYTDGVADRPRSARTCSTAVGVLDVGPDLQFIANPGEAFPALMLGSPWGIEDAGCPDAPEPARADLARARARTASRSGWPTT